MAIFICMISCMPSSIVSLTSKQEMYVPFAYDFREYSNKGFLFTPFEYFGEYDVKGMVTVELHPAVQYTRGHQSARRGYTAYQFYRGDERWTKVTKEVDVDSLINYVYELSLEWGGDAFSNFKAGVKVGYTDPGNESTGYSYYYIDGIVIKRQ